MASTAVDFLVSKLSESLFNMAKEELARQMGVTEDIHTLVHTLEELQYYLLDAEKKSIEEASTNRWLQQIKDIMYDIEDVLDEYSLVVDESVGLYKSSTSIKPRFVDKIWLSLKKASPKRRISIQIQALKNQLKEIMSQIPRLALMRSIYSSSSREEQATSSQLCTAHMSHPIVVRSDIVGRRVQDDGRRLVELLTKEDDRDNLLVFAVVGTGGIGKTTLAKLAFDDHMIKSHFDVKAWVSVSPICNELNILKNIMESATGKEEQGQNLSLLCEKFRRALNEKRVFVVLDDVWEVEIVWNRLLKSLLKSSVGRGSRVLVTTRNNEVAEKMMAVYSHSVESLSVEDGWLLLRKAAFPSWEQDEAGDDAWGLKDVGTEFVMRCNGLPLAINAIGGILSSESRTRDAWASILKNSLWEVKGLPTDIHTALYMSYQHLPPHIKQCFLYFSLIPKGLFFRSVTAAEQWIEEGFIKEEDSLSIYDVGESCLRLLARRNLLMSVQLSAEENGFYMHDLLRSLAQFLAQNESRLVSNEEELLKIKSSGRQMKLRRLSYITGGGEPTAATPKSMTQHDSLRTLLLFDRSISRIDKDLFNNLHRLRLISLLGTSLKELPPSVGSLTHLRFLNLTSTLISELPSTIGNLTNLRVLNVSGCINLFKLPPCIMNLHRLRTLATSESALIHLPPELGRLHELQRLDFIFPLENIGSEFSSLNELSELKQLRMLNLHKLERAMDPSKVRSANLKGKHQLETLALVCSKNEFYSQLYSPEAEHIADKLKEVYEDLCPPTQLRKLYIIDYFGRQLPNWLSPSLSNLLLANLRYFKLMGCSNCEKLPGLGLLPNLEELEIGWASSVKYIDPQFYTGNKHSGETASGPFFPRLKLLHYIYMDNLEEWASPEGCISFMPRLETLIIRGCPNLKSLPEGLLCDATSLKRVIIEGAEKLHLKAVQNDPLLEALVLNCIGHLERISDLPSLQMLSVIGCLKLNEVDVTGTLERLIWWDFNAETVPEWLSNDSNGVGKLTASFLEMRCNERLLRKTCDTGEGVEGPEFYKIQHFDNISAWNRNGVLRLSYNKTPYSFTVHPPKRGAN